MYARNNTLNILNLSLNELDEASVERLEAFLNVSHETFSLILPYNKFEVKTKDILKKRFAKKIAMWKESEI